jgi:electron transfer flavoprotein beta subunit
MVLVYSDNKNLTIEILSKGSELAREIGEKLITVIIGKNDEKLADEYISYGSDEVYIVENEIEFFKSEEFSEILEKIIKETSNNYILIGSNKNGKELASRLAGKIDAGCIIDCSNIYLKDKKVTAERTVYSGNAIAIEQFNSTPGILTVSSKVFDPLKKDEKRKGNIVKKKYDIIICGEASTDLFSGQMGPKIAGLLNIPQITYAFNLNVENDKIIGERNMGENSVTTESTYPVLVTVTKEINEPRLPSLMEILGSANKPIHEWKADSLLTETNTKVDTIDIKGVSMERKNIIFEDSIDDSVSKLVDSLAKDGVLG